MLTWDAFKVRQCAPNGSQESDIKMEMLTRQVILSNLSILGSFSLFNSCKSCVTLFYSRVIFSIFVWTDSDESVADDQPHCSWPRGLPRTTFGGKLAFPLSSGLPANVPPSQVDNFMGLCPLEPPASSPLHKSSTFSYVTTVYKAVNIKTGQHMCLRRIHGYRLVNTKCMGLVSPQDCSNFEKKRNIGWFLGNSSVNQKFTQWVVHWQFFYYKDV